MLPDFSYPPIGGTETPGYKQQYVHCSKDIRVIRFVTLHTPPAVCHEYCLRNHFHRMSVSDFASKLCQLERLCTTSGQSEVNIPFLASGTYSGETRLDAVYPLWLRPAFCSSGHLQQGKWVAS